MKTKELEIALTTYIALKHNQDECSGFIDGYKQCQEDMADYIFEVAFQFHRLGKYSGNTSDTHFTDIYEETINSLNKQKLTTKNK
jgi:hypothetical protein